MDSRDSPDSILVRTSSYSGDRDFPEVCWTVRMTFPSAALLSSRPTSAATLRKRCLSPTATRTGRMIRRTSAEEHAGQLTTAVSYAA